MHRQLGTGMMLMIVVLALVGIVAAGEAQPAAKATAKVGAINIMDASSLEWTTILENDIRTANRKDLFIDVSLECGLYTDTTVKSNGNRATSQAEAGVEVQVLVDGEAAYPGTVVFCRRTQTLSALFGGILKNCTDSNNDGDIDLTECTLAPEELQLVLDTMNANAFNFILDDLEAGTHTVAVQARINTFSDGSGGGAKAEASVGNGSVTVEEVRMIKGEDILLD